MTPFTTFCLIVLPWCAAAGLFIHTVEQGLLIRRYEKFKAWAGSREERIGIRALIEDLKVIVYLLDASKPENRGKIAAYKHCTERLQVLVDAYEKELPEDNRLGDGE